MALCILKPEIQNIFDSCHLPFVSVIDVERESKEITKKNFDALLSWLNKQAHGEMGYMENNLDVRQQPEKIMSGVKTIALVAVPYANGEQVRGKGIFKNEETGILPLVARYAQGKDYHRVLKKKLNLAGDQLKTIYKDLEFRAVVDSVPFFDRAFAKEAGLGFVGKNTMLIRPGLGSYFFIASLFLSISADALVASKSANHAIFNLDCGDCRKCMDACPTGAIEDPYFLNATKCLSYLSIEHRGVVKENFLPHFAKTMYGCDICQEVCPYNLKTRDFLEIADITRAHQPLGRISVMDVARMSESEYESWFGGTAMTRAKYAGLVRNALYHLWAVQSESLPEILLHRKSDPHALIAETVAQILSLK